MTHRIENFYAQFELSKVSVQKQRHLHHKLNSETKDAHVKVVSTGSEIHVASP